MLALSRGAYFEGYTGTAKWRVCRLHNLPIENIKKCPLAPAGHDHQEATYTYRWKNDNTGLDTTVYSMTTLSTLQEDLVAYRAARLKILSGQEYWIGSRKVRRPDLALVENAIKELETRIAILQNDGKIKTEHAVFRGAPVRKKPFQFDVFSRAIASTIGVFFPGAAISYLHKRKQLAQYTAARSTGPDKNWRPGNQSADAILARDRAVIMSLARDLERNSPHVSGAINKIINNIVFTGIFPQARIKGADGKLKKAQNDRIETAFTNGPTLLILHETRACFAPFDH
jgi:hypothetical protein